MSLFNVLVGSEFNFIKGEKSIEDIYAKVQKKFSTLCDDSFLCSDNCKDGHNQPEWKHHVRNALTSMKARGIVKKGKRGYWIF